MSRSQATGRRRGLAGLMPFLLGLPMGAGIVWLAWAGPLQGTIVERYLHHPVEWAEVLLVCVALWGLLLRFARLRVERAALGRELVPAWDGEPVPVSTATALQQTLKRQPRRWQDTLLGRRLASILDFVTHRRSATGLDDHLRTLADNDALAQEAAGTFVRFIIWAVPILGFLGTVLGITGAVAGITPEKLEKGLSEVADGLALAFDATALALSMTMVLMLLNSSIDRIEQALFEDIDGYLEQHVAHRFERTEAVSSSGGPPVHALEELVKKQASLWAEAQVQADQQRIVAETKVHERLQASLAATLERTLEVHSRRLTELEQHSARHLASLMAKTEELARSAAGHAETIRRLHEGEKQLLSLQQALQQNLQALAGAGAFDQAVHSLTAAIHLLTSTTRSHRPGAAA